MRKHGIWPVASDKPTSHPKATSMADGVDDFPEGWNEDLSLSNEIINRLQQ
jgi:hypothetical protein